MHEYVSLHHKLGQGKMCMLNGQSWLPVTFTLKDGGVELHYERYLFRKVGRLP